MTPFLTIIMQLLPFAIKIVEKWMEEDEDECVKRNLAVDDLIKQTGCKENEARCAVELGVGEAKTKNQGESDGKV